MKTWPYENIYYRLKDNQPRLIASSCKNCGHVSFPQKQVCPSCVSMGTLEELELSETGTIETFSVLHVGAPGFPVPYVVGYVKMKEGPSAFGVIQHGEASMEDIQIGSKVRIVLGKIRNDDEGNEVMGFQFLLIDEKNGVSS